MYKSFSKKISESNIGDKFLILNLEHRCSNREFFHITEIQNIRQHLLVAVRASNKRMGKDFYEYYPNFLNDKVPESFKRDLYLPKGCLGLQQSPTNEKVIRFEHEVSTFEMIWNVFLFIIGYSLYALFNLFS